MAAKAKKAKRTTHRTTKGKKVYAVRTAAGVFSDIQSYKKAHGSDVQRASKAETTGKKKRTTKAKRK
jgi:hypothetical protein